MKKTLLLGVAMLCTQLSFGQYVPAYTTEYNYSSIMPSSACTRNDVGTDTRDASGGSNYYANFLNVTVNSCPDAVLGTPSFNWESSHGTSGILPLPADAYDPDVVLVSPDGSDEAWAIAVYYSPSNNGYCMSVSQFMPGIWAFTSISGPMLIQNYSPTNYEPHINIDADELGHYAVVMQLFGQILSTTQTHLGGTPLVPVNPSSLPGLMEPDVAYVGSGGNEITVVAVTDSRNRYRAMTRDYLGTFSSYYTSPLMPYLYQPRIAAPVSGGTNDYSVTVGREYVGGPNTYNDILFQYNEGVITVVNDGTYAGLAALNVNNRNALPCLSYAYNGYMTGEQVSLGWYVASIGINPMQPNTFIGLDILTASLLPNTTTYMDVSNYYGMNNESTLALSGRHTVWAKTAAFTYTSSVSPLYAAQLVWKYEYSGAAHWKTTAIQNIAGNEEQLSVYPNPAYNQISINIDKLGESYDYEIMNQLGQVVDKGKLVEQHTEIAVAKWASGLYIIKAKNKETNKVSTLKFVKN